jgi:hypothetical protein
VKRRARSVGATIPPTERSDRLEAGFVERWAPLRLDRDHAGHYNLAHDQAPKRLRAELVVRQATPPSGIMKMLRGLKARFGIGRG